MTDPGIGRLWPGSPEYWAARLPCDRAVEELRQGDGISFGVVARYLEERPRFLQSGHIVERMLRYLSRVDWSADQRARLERIVRSIATEGRTREAREAQRLLVRWAASDGDMS